MILFLSRSLGIVRRIEQDLIACSAILRPFFKSHIFLFGTTATPSFTFYNSHFFSGQSWHASSSLIMLYLWLGARRPMAAFFVV
jgi:hypothetical protein